MKIVKLSSVLLLAMFFICAFTPHASAKHCKSRSFFGLSFNFGRPSYVVAPAPAVVAPAPVVVPAPVAVAPYPYYVAGPVYNAPVVRGRAPCYYVQPSFSYSYCRRY